MAACVRARSGSCASNKEIKSTDTARRVCDWPSKQGLNGATEQSRARVDVHKRTHQGELFDQRQYAIKHVSRRPISKALPWHTHPTIARDCRCENTVLHGAYKQAVGEQCAGVMCEESTAVQWVTQVLILMHATLSTHLACASQKSCIRPSHLRGWVRCDGEQDVGARKHECQRTR
jgi:hypothetical protein